jgi:L-glutamine-phosphate cytidylyltransferase
MKAVILAAGMGTRLGTLIPKPLTSLVDEKTIMDYQVERLAEAVGIDNILAIVGYKKELVMEKFPELSFVYNHAYTQTNTAKSLLSALRKLDDDVLWMNGDVYFWPAVLQKLIASPTSAALVDTKKCGDEEIKYTLNKQGTIVELSKQVQNGVGEAVGINLIKRQDLAAFCAELEKVGPQDYFEKALENLTMAGKLTLTPVQLDDLFCQEIDFPEDLESVRAHMAAA